MSAGQVNQRLQDLETVVVKQLGVREERERRDPGAHPRLHRDLPDRRGSDEDLEFVQVDDFPGRQDWGGRIQDSRTRRAWSMLKRVVRYLVDV